MRGGRANLAQTGLLVALTAAGPVYAMPEERLRSMVAPLLRDAVIDLERIFAP